MKASLAALAGAFLVIHCPWTLAASSVDLTVTGTITPSACTVIITSGNVVELGKVAARDIEQDSMTYLPTAPVDMTVNCEAPTLFALAPQDNRPQMYTPWAFGFAMMPSGKPMGGYWLDYVDAVADGTKPMRLYSENNGQGWKPASDYDAVEPRKLTGFGTLLPSPGTVRPYQNLTLSLRLNPFFYPAKQWLQPNEEIPIDGSATFELRYL
ncbi:MAG: Protein GltF [Pseudomonas sp.]|nr:MAG: Protein GltF [Pseudomonas sp.]